MMEIMAAQPGAETDLHVRESGRIQFSFVDVVVAGSHRRRDVEETATGMNRRFEV